MRHARNAAAGRPVGACDFVEDPRLDARQAHPLWAASTDELLRVRAVGAHDATAREVFSLWQIPGQKRLAHAGSHLIVAAMHGPHCLRASLSTALEDGVAYGFTVPLDAHLRTRLAKYQTTARAVRGAVPRPAFRQVARGSLLHLRAIHALDAAQAGARHRDIAEVLFGADAVRSRWTADSELRAQVRHLLNRAEGLMRGGYLALAGVRHRHDGAPGGEAGT
jgi:hypothetical protein